MLSDSRIVTDADKGSDCDVLVNDIFNNLCVKGAHCAVRYVDEWIESDFDSRLTFQVGSKKTLTVWAVEGFCEKNGVAFTSDNY